EMVKIRDGRQASFRIEGHALEQELIVGDRLSVEDTDGVAVGRRLTASAGAKILHAAWPVLHHDRLAPALVQLLAECAHEDVADAARAGGGQRPDRTRRIVLRERRGCKSRDGKRYGGK